MAHTHTQMYRPWPSQQEELYVQPMLYRGCNKVES